MASEIANLIAHANALQEAVEGMLMLRREDDLILRQFLGTLPDADSRFLLVLDFDRKVLYLERRFVLYCDGLGR